MKFVDQIIALELGTGFFCLLSFQLETRIFLQTLPNQQNVSQMNLPQ